MDELKKCLMEVRNIRRTIAVARDTLISGYRAHYSSTECDYITLRTRTLRGIRKVVQ